MRIPTSALAAGARADQVWGGASAQANSYRIDGLSTNDPRQGTESTSTGLPLHPPRGFRGVLPGPGPRVGEPCALLLPAPHREPGRLSRVRWSTIPMSEPSSSLTGTKVSRLSSWWREPSSWR